MFNVMPDTAKKEMIKQYLDHMILDDVEVCYLRFNDRIVCLTDDGVGETPIDKFNMDLRSEEYKAECEAEERRLKGE